MIICVVIARLPVLINGKNVVYIFMLLNQQPMNTRIIRYLLASNRKQRVQK